MSLVNGELLEREDALRWLHERRDDVLRSAEGSASVVHGEAGIGKTSVLRRFVAELGSQAVVLWGSCDPLRTPRPLAPLADFAHSAAGPSLAQTIRRGSQAPAVFDALLEDLSRSSGTVAVVEDAHWADEVTIDALVFAARRIGTTGALLVVSYRDDEVGPSHPLRLAVRELAPRSNQRLHLRPLSSDAVNVMAAGSEVDATRLHAVTGGNPFFVTEVLAAGSLTVPTSVHEAVVARTGRLSEEAQTVLDVSAISPGGAELWLIDALVGHDASNATDECVRAGILVSEPTRLAFRHELARLAVLGRLAPGRLRALHREALRRLAEHPLGCHDAARLAHHAAATGDPVDVRHYVRRAAAHASGLGAHREAAEHYRVVAQFGADLDRPDRAQVATALSYECYLTDQLEESLAVRHEALALWRDTGDLRQAGDCLRWLSRVSWFLGHGADADRFGREAVDTLQAFPGTTEQAWAYSNLAQLRMLAGDGDEALAWATRAIEAARSIGSVDVECHALNNRGTTRLNAGDMSGRTDIEMSLAIAVQNQFHEHAARAYTNLSAAFIHLRRLAEAEPYLADGIDYCERRDLDSWSVYMTGWLSLSRFLQGRWDEAGTIATRVLNRPGAAPTSRLTALVVLGRLRARRGDPEVWGVLDEALRIAVESGELQRLGPVAAARAEACWLAGDEARVAEACALALELAEEHHDEWTVGELQWWMRRAGRDIVVSENCAEPYARHLAGDHRGAALAWEAIGAPYEAAEALAEVDDPATRLEGMARLEALGAMPLARRVRTELRRAGVVVPRGPNAATSRNPAGLSDRELEVLELLVTGQTNAEIARELGVSMKTAGHHVSHILTKLGARSRTEAAALAARLGLTATSK